MSTQNRNVRVAVCGAAGRMGREVIRAVSEDEGLTLVAAIDHAKEGADSGALAGIEPNGIPIELQTAAGSDSASGLRAALTRTAPDVLIDFTLPEGLMGNLRCALDLGVYSVVGTTGLNSADLDELDRLSRDKHVAVFVAPNFAIGAVLLMQFAEMAAAYLPDVEIIELHHDRKLDSPSGTALLTAQRIEAARNRAGAHPLPVPEGLIEKSPGARGARAVVTGDVPIHSVRLQGFVAHQEVIFGGPGQVLTIRHDSIDRKSFMPGVVLAARKVQSLSGLVVGLEKLMSSR